MHFLFRIFDLRQSETKAVGLLLLHAFFNGLGIALSFTAANLLFLQSFGAEELPKAYTISAFVLLFAGFLYAKLEHALEPAKLFKWVVVLCALITIACWAGLSLYHSAYMVFVLFVAYWLIYMLTNLEFWGAAALLFNVRQSKRLFGLVGSGETISKICGYLISPLIVSYFSTTELALAAGISFALSTLFIWKLVKHKPKTFKAQGHEHEHVQHHAMGLGTLLKTLKNDTFIFWISLLAFFGVSVYFIITFSFLKRVEETMQNQAEMATFFGLFFGIGKAVNFLTKSLFSSRLMKTIGVKSLLLILPLVLLVINGIGVFGQFFGAEAQFFVWIFGFNMLFDEVARSSLLKPAFLVLFQPLHHHRRLQGHTVSKGIMEPLGMALAGALLILITTFFGLDLKIVSYFLFSMVLLWFLVAIKVNKEYIAILHNALKQRWLGKNKLNLNEKQARSLLFQKLYSDNAADIVYALEILDTKRINDLEDILKNALKSDNEVLLKSVLTIIETNKIEGLAHSVQSYFTHSDTELAKKAIMVYGTLKEVAAINELEKLLYQNNTVLAQAALAAILKNCGIYGATTSGDLLLQKLSGTEKEQREAANIIGEIGARSYYHPLISLLQSTSRDVVYSAIKACGKVKNEKLLPYLKQHLSNQEYYSALFYALEQFGDRIYKADFISAFKSKREKKFILKISASINSPESRAYIEKHLFHKNIEIKRIAISMLFKIRYTTNKKEELNKVVSLLKESATTYSHLVMLETQLMSQIRPLVQSAITSEKNIIRETVLSLFAFLYDREAILRIKDSFAIGNEELTANTLERLEMLVSSKLKYIALVLFDEKDTLHLINKSKKQLGLLQSVPRISYQIIYTSKYVSSYTRAIFLHYQAIFNTKIDLEKLVEMTNADSQILAEESLRVVFGQQAEMANQDKVMRENPELKSAIINQLKLQ